jgi:hypothetical protein
MVPDPVFVVSLLLADSDDPSEVVLGVRQPSLQAPRHPGVLSTPTQRVPRPFFEACCATWPVPADDAFAVTPVSGEEVAVGVGPSSSRPLSYLVEALLTRKLGLGDALVDRAVRGVAAPVAIGAGLVDDPQGGGAPEPTVMLSVDVRLAGLRAALPDGTRYYAPLTLAPTASLAAALDRRDALVVSELLDPFEVCIGGLCIASAVAVVESVSGG